MLRKTYRLTIVPGGRISEWKNLKWVCASKEDELILSHKSYSFTVDLKEELKSRLCVRERKSLAQQDYTLLLQEAWSHCACNTGASATSPNQLPFVRITDATHAVPEFLCTGVPEPGLLGLISKVAQLETMVICTDYLFHGKWQIFFHLNSKSKAAICRNTNIIFKETKPNPKW